MVQQLPGISVVKSPCAAWEGRLGKGSGGFCAGEAGGGRSRPGSWGAGTAVGAWLGAGHCVAAPAGRIPAERFRTALPEIGRAHV